MQTYRVKVAIWWECVLSIYEATRSSASGTEIRNQRLWRVGCVIFVLLSLHLLETSEAGQEMTPKVEKAEIVMRASQQGD
jgi:hypothetical protein